MNHRRRNHMFIMASLFSGVILSMASPVAGSQYLQIPGVIHVHSTFSSGKYSLSDLVGLAESSGVGVLAVTDHDWVAMEYGLAPLRRLIKVRKELPSVLRIGVRDYLDQINTLNAAQRKVILLPGVQSSPFYYWTGNPFTGGLTAHDYRKELITIGMSSPADYENLPALHKTGFSGISKSHLFFWLGAMVLFSWQVWRSRHRKRDIIRIAVVGAAILLLINYHPFQSSGYDPYHGSQAEAPYQDYIDYVQSHGGMAFWSHPESTFSAAGRDLGPIRMKTSPYPASLLRTRNYTGFAAFYGESAAAQKPGLYWDDILMEYCAGFRNRPVWAIAEADFHGTDKNEALDRYLTVFLVREKTQPAVLEAMARGRMYAVIKQGTARPTLEDFQVTDTVNGRAAVSGECLSGGVSPEISGRLSASDGRHYETEVSVIKNGKVIQVINDQTPFEFHVRDAEKTPGKSAYRLEAIINNVGRIIANPIFVDYGVEVVTTRK